MIALIEPGHLFSQHSLNTFLRCPRRFLLKYVDHQPWPMPEDDEPEKYQKSLERGRIFHQWLARRHLGIDIEPIVSACADAELQGWWRVAQGFALDELPSAICEAELAIAVPLGDYRLYARFDFVAIDPGEDAAIVDWKTLVTVPSDRRLRQRVQTRVYLYTLVAAGSVLTGGVPIEPNDARMIYWFANHPTQTATVPYSRQAFQRDARDLESLVMDIVQRRREDMHMTDDRRECTRCNYRSLCRRSGIVESGEEKDWLDEDLDFDLELEDVPELDY